MSLMKTFQTICAADGLLTRRFRERHTVSTQPSANTSAAADGTPLNRAKVAILTEVDGEYILTFARGDHDCERWVITEESLRAITLMGVKKLL